MFIDWKLKYDYIYKIIKNFSRIYLIIFIKKLLEIFLYIPKIYYFNEDKKRIFPILFPNYCFI